jgi:hypothetical protein
MRVSDEVKKFIDNLKSSGENYSTVVDLIESDRHKIETDTTDAILRGELNIDYLWSDYVLSDINIVFDDNILKILDLLKMYGVEKEFPNLNANSKGIIITYQYSYVNNVTFASDTLNFIHVGIDSDGEYENKWLMLQ